MRFYTLCLLALCYLVVLVKSSDSTKYYVKNSKSGLCLTYSTIAVQNGSSIKFQTLECRNGNAYKWYVKGNKLVSVNNNKCLGFYNNNPADKTLVDCNSSQANTLTIKNNTVCMKNNSSYCMSNNGYFTKYKNNSEYKWNFVKA